MISWGCCLSPCEGRFLFLNGPTVCMSLVRVLCAAYATFLMGTPPEWSYALCFCCWFALSAPQQCLSLELLQALSELCSHKHCSQDQTMLSLPFCHHAGVEVCHHTGHLSMLLPGSATHFPCAWGCVTASCLSLNSS